MGRSFQEASSAKCAAPGLTNTSGVFRGDLMKAFLAFFAAALAATVVPAGAQLLIYDLALEKTGRSVNFANFEGGYLVVDTTAATFDSLIVANDPNTFAPYQAPGFVGGSYSLTRDYSGRVHAVLFGASSTGDNAALQVLGPIDSNRNVGGKLRANVSEKLRGFLLASSPESTSGGNGTATTFEYGFAGSDRAAATYNPNLTRQANSQSLDGAGALNFLGILLSNRGIPGPTPTPTPSPSPTATPTPTPTPTPSA